MNFRDQLLAELSKRNTDYIASVVNRDKTLFKELIEILLSNEKLVSGRAGWVIETIWLKYPQMIKPYINDLIDFLPKAHRDNQRRHCLKILSTINLETLDEERLGILIDRCFTWLEDPIYPPAVKVLSMQIIFNYVKIESLIASELIAIIENQFEDATPGFKNRGEKLLKELYKLE
ncbi:MAG: hypothetical protein KQH79_09425 [Bacteroidetes bacterium]|nr:hypothetical protein [Bacteroidota bacterium]